MALFSEPDTIAWMRLTVVGETGRGYRDVLGLDHPLAAGQSPRGVFPLGFLDVLGVGGLDRGDLLGPFPHDLLVHPGEIQPAHLAVARFRLEVVPDLVAVGPGRALLQFAAFNLVGEPVGQPCAVGPLPVGRQVTGSVQAHDLGTRVRRLLGGVEPTVGD
jgi:hypothetical protein